MLPSWRCGGLGHPGPPIPLPFPALASLALAVLFFHCSLRPPLAPSIGALPRRLSFGDLCVWSSSGKQFLSPRTLGSLPLSEMAWPSCSASRVRGPVKRQPSHQPQGAKPSHTATANSRPRPSITSVPTVRPMRTASNPPKGHALGSPSLILMHLSRSSWTRSQSMASYTSGTFPNAKAPSPRSATRPRA
jgi:hypothetical protein